jgi:hypothetical protein
MAEALRECFAMLGGVQKKPAVAAYIDKFYSGRWSPNTLQGHLYGCCINNPTGIKHHRGFPRFLYYRGGGEYEIYDAGRHGVFDEKGYPEGQAPADIGNDDLREEIAQQIEEKIGTEFAYEAHLRDYLAKNLSILEDGLILWSPNGASAIEFQLEGRRIDILVKDRSGIPVVIELKLSRGHDRTVGQALYYRAKLKQLFSITKVRIVLVAAEITDELRLAASEVNDIELFQYSLTMKLDPVKI